LGDDYQSPEKVIF